MVLAGVLALVLLLGACADPSVRLTYQFPAGNTSRSIWNIDAKVESDTPSLQQIRSFVLRIEVLEKSLEDSKISLGLKPQFFSENGIRLDPPAPAFFEMEVSSDGRVKNIRSLGPLPSGLAGSELERLITELRPRLPSSRVEIGDEWDAGLTAKTERTSAKISGSANLVGFALEDRRRLAEIKVSRLGKVGTQLSVGRASLMIPGFVRTTTVAKVDLDRGALVESHSTSHSTFELSKAGGGLAGFLKVRIVASSHLT